MNRTYCVYILASRSRTLYTGVTNNLERRTVEHHDGLVPGFTTRYKIFRLVHFEVFGDIRSAIAREKEIKAWRREKKIGLIARHNPTWEDLAEALGKDKQAQERRIRIRREQEQQQIPHRRSPKAGERVRDDPGGDHTVSASSESGRDSIVLRFQRACFTLNPDQ
jgi:putative endonuclease